MQLKNAQAPAPKKHADSRYVSVFADSTPDVDITFRVAFLRHPTDYYVCGVDDLSLCISNLGCWIPTTWKSCRSSPGSS